MKREYKTRNKFGKSISTNRGNLSPRVVRSNLDNVQCTDHEDDNMRCGIMITQVHWNPSAGLGYEDTEWEYVEITNTNPYAVGMTSVVLTSQTRVEVNTLE